MADRLGKRLHLCYFALMKIYLVGGAVRDALLGLPVLERDWVVVGASAGEMQRLGYRQVGKDFPVFLHPETGDEYALARTERQTGPGHRGFVVHAGAEVTLEQDLERRDLTVNAIAEDADGHLIDPCGGRVDLQARVLRHVSSAFAEDPLRVFRVARFAARLPEFEVAPETLELMRRMSAEDRLRELSPERIWGELEKALEASAPERFFLILEQANGLSPWLAELIDYPVRIPAQLLEREQRFAALLADLDLEACERLCERLKVPRRYSALAHACMRHSDVLARWREMPADEVHSALTMVRGFKKGSVLDALLKVIEAIRQIDLEALRRCVHDIVRSVTAEPLRSQGLKGAQLGSALAQAQIEAIRVAQR